jgi:hypothetical protein
VGVHLVFHAWAAAPVVEEGRVTGAVFESKEGRLAIRAEVTIDCTGDGDLFHPAGAGRESNIDELAHRLTRRRRRGLKRRAHSPNQRCHCNN